MKSWMDRFIPESFYIQFLLSKIIIIFLSKLFQLSKKGCFLCIHHSMGYFLEFLIGFPSWILQEIPIYGCDLVCLAELYRKIMVVFLYTGIYSIPSINHSKERWWIARIRKIMKKDFIISFCFLGDVLGSKHISRDSIYCHQKSPLGI